VTQISQFKESRMKFRKKFLLVLTLVALLAALFATTAFAAGRKEVYQQHASVTKAKVMSTGPGAATIRVMGSYTCDKVRTHTSVSGKTIYIEVWDVKNKGNDCNNSHTYTRDLSFKFLVPGKYTVLVNLHPKTGQAQRKLTNLVIPVYPATPTPATAP